MRFDSAFERVIAECARTPRGGQHGTWIVPALRSAYAEWHHAGTVHSVETWVDGRLVGGLYAVNLGRMVFGESMFSHATDASKIRARRVGGVLPRAGHHADRLPAGDHAPGQPGAREIPRAAFEAHLATSVGAAAAPAWTYDAAQWDRLFK